MSNYNSNLQSKNVALQAILDKINNLPESDSEIVLPELTNEGSASDLLSGKQLIDGDGNVVTGTIPTQAAKTITPSTSSQTAVASGVYTTGAVTVAAIPSNYEDVATETTEYTSLNDELEDVINSLPNAGGGGGGSVDTCTVNIISKGLGGIRYYGVTQHIDGVITNTIVAFEENAPANLTFENVVCGSFLCFHTRACILPAYSVTNGSIVKAKNEGLRIWLVSLTSSPNVTETITVWEND